MKVNFSSSNNSGKDKASKIQAGTYEDMIKMRKKQLPELEETIQEVLKDYDGGMIAIMQVKEDENGMGEGHSVFIGGVGHVSTQIQMGKALMQASDQIRDLMIESAKGDPKALKGILGALVEEMLDGLDK